MNYLLEGNDTYRIKERIDAITSEEGLSPDDFNFEKVSLDTCSITALVSMANQIPFFGDRRIIVVNDADLNLRTEKKLGLVQEDQDLLLRYLEKPCPTTTLIFDTSASPLRSSDVTKKIKKLCKYEKIDPLTPEQLESMVKADLKKYGIKIGPAALKDLLDRLPADVANWKSELEKLRNYPGEITSKTVKDLVVRPLFGSGDKDNLLFTNAILARDLKRTMIYWNDITTATKDCYGLISLTATQLRFMYKVKYLASEGYPKYEIAQRMGGINEYRVQKTLESASRFPLEDISALLDALAVLDRQIKTGEIEDKLGFELFLMKAAGGKRLWNR